MKANTITTVRAYRMASIFRTTPALTGDVRIVIGVYGSLCFSV
jgi:hypothetical protein